MPLPPDAANQRRFSRVLFDSRAALHGPDAVHDAQLLDLSLKGALLAVPAGHGLSPQMRCRLDIDLGAEQRIRMEVDLVHVHGERIGCRCERIDVESMTHLARVVQLNSGDPELLQRELGALGDFTA